MGEGNVSPDYPIIINLLHQIRTIPKEFWRKGELRFLPNKEVPVNLKEGLLSVLEVVNFVYENEMDLAIKRFKELSQEEAHLLFFLVGAAKNLLIETNQQPSYSEEERKNQMFENVREHNRRIEELSRNKTYEVSEQYFQELIEKTTKIQFLIGKLEAITDLLDEDDPRFDFASTLLESYYDHI